MWQINVGGSRLKRGQPKIHVYPEGRYQAIAIGILVLASQSEEWFPTLFTYSVDNDKKTFHHLTPRSTESLSYFSIHVLAFRFFVPLDRRRVSMDAVRVRVKGSEWPSIPTQDGGDEPIER